MRRPCLRRRPGRTTLAAWLLLLVVILGSTRQTAAAGWQAANPPELLVRFTDTTSPGEIDVLVGRAHGSVVQRQAALGMAQVRLGYGRSTARALARLRASNKVLYAEPNYPVQAQVRPHHRPFAPPLPAGGPAVAPLIPNNPGLWLQWALWRVQAPRAWALFPGSFAAPRSAAVVAIVDTGIDLQHPALQGQLVPGTSLVPETTPQDDNGHGTHCAGIVAAAANDGIGVAGLAFTARLMPVKVLDATGSGTAATVAGGMVWAVDHGANVISLSLASDKYSQALQDAVDYALRHNVLVVAAAGNSGDNQPLYPAAMQGVLAVAATDSQDAVADFSSFGPWVAVSAPGVFILSTSLGSYLRYAFDSGTSMAAPHVAALAALLLGQDRTRTPAALRRLILDSADKVGSFEYVGGRNDHYGAGRINAYKALGGT